VVINLMLKRICQYKYSLVVFFYPFVQNMFDNSQVYVNMFISLNLMVSFIKHLGKLIKGTSVNLVHNALIELPSVWSFPARAPPPPWPMLAPPTGPHHPCWPPPVDPPCQLGNNCQNFLGITVVSICLFGQCLKTARTDRHQCSFNI